MECGLSVFDDAKVYQKMDPCKKNAEKVENIFIFGYSCVEIIYDYIVSSSSAPALSFNSSSPPDLFCYICMIN